MSIQNIRGVCVEGKLQLSWILLEDCDGIAIKVARDSEFTETLRMFILPKIPGCALDVGRGLWFFRAGHMKKGQINWMGIQAPVIIQTQKEPPTLAEPFLKVISTQPITGAVRINTDSQIPSYTVLEYTEKAKFSASYTKTRYFYDPTRGYFDCEGLDPAHKYNIRMACPETPSELPKGRIDMLSSWIMLHGKQSLPFMKPHDSQDQSQRRRDAVILKEVNESKKPIRFGSQSEYAKYLSAKARNVGERS